jgi:hypothetical protein
MSLVGKTFGRWRVVAPLAGRWLVRCSCVLGAGLLRERDLLSGRSRSCGCLQRTRGGVSVLRTAEYVAWANIHARCSDEDDPRYGGRGIGVAERWRDFDSFLADVGERPSPRHSLERLDNDRGYEPGNVVWATPKTQARNRRSTRLVDGVSMAELAERSGVPYATLQSRLDRGWSVERAVGAAVRSYRGGSARALKGGMNDG